MPRFRSTPNISLAELTAILDDRRRELQKLYKRRRDLERDVERMDRAIARIEGAGGRGSRARARNELSLAATIAQVLGKAAKPLPVAEIVQGVEAAGYRSGSANFRALVNMTLVKGAEFQGVSRGIYALKGRETTSRSSATRGKRKRSRPTQRVEAAKVEQPSAA